VTGLTLVSQVSHADNEAIPPGRTDCEFRDTNGDGFQLEYYAGAAYSDAPGFKSLFTVASKTPAARAVSGVGTAACWDGTELWVDSGRVGLHLTMGIQHDPKGAATAIAIAVLSHL
jgi:hypothetical protein